MGKPLLYTITIPLGKKGMSEETMKIFIEKLQGWTRENPIVNGPPARERSENYGYYILKQAVKRREVASLIVYNLPQALYVATYQWLKNARVVFSAAINQ